MNYTEYLALFDEVLNLRITHAPYNKPKYFNYTKLNQARTRRWEKTLQLDEQLSKAIQNISQPQRWIIISEPWCGDSAPAMPFLIRMAMLNPLITYDIQLRDVEPFLINHYLTRGTKSIPKLIVQDAGGKDLFTWGPRPKAAQEYINSLKATGMEPEDVKTELQQWYNQDKGTSMQQELLEEMRQAGIIAG